MLSHEKQEHARTHIKAKLSEAMPIRFSLLLRVYTHTGGKYDGYFTQFINIEHFCDSHRKQYTLNYDQRKENKGRTKLNKHSHYVQMRLPFNLELELFYKLSNFKIKRVSFIVTLFFLCQPILHKYFFFFRYSILPFFMLFSSIHSLFFLLS